MEKNLIEIYNRLKKVLKKYENPLKPRFDLDSKYDLWSDKDIVIDGRKRKEVYFAGLIIQSKYVGFYFMPIYSDPDKFKLTEELKKTLHGKTCFYIKDTSLIDQVEELLITGKRLYKEKGWI